MTQWVLGQAGHAMRPGRTERPSRPAAPAMETVSQLPVYPEAVRSSLLQCKVLANSCADLNLVRT